VRIHHLALRVSDLERCRAFYSDLLGLPELRRFEERGAVRSIWLKAGESLLMIESRLRGAGPDSGSGHLLAFEVDDLDRWGRRLVEAGVPLDDRTASTIYCRDPEGHRVGLTVFRLS